MAESASAAPRAASIPSSADIARAEKLVRERFLHEGEDPAQALAPGTPRRGALDMALAELEEDPKRTSPSTAWRREFSLLLGLERILSEEEPKLADGTILSAHQVDALSGTLTALLAEEQRKISGGNGRSNGSASPELLASAAILGLDEPDRANGAAEAPAPVEDAEEDEDLDEDEDELDDDEDDEDDDLGPVARAAPDEDEDDDDELEGELLDGTDIDDDEEETAEESELQGDGEEPQDWVEEGEDEESLADSRRTPTQPSASGSSTPRGPERRWRHSASWRPPRPGGS